MHPVPTSLWERLSQFSSGDLVTLLFIIICAVVVTITIIGTIIYTMHKNRLEDTLKRELLDRGMSADEIATVISAKPVKGESKRSVRP